MNGFFLENRTTDVTLRQSERICAQLLDLLRTFVVVSDHSKNLTTARWYETRVFGFRMAAVKNSMNLSPARRRANATTAGTGKLAKPVVTGR